MNKTKITAEPGVQELTVTREFDAPRELVFRAFTDPALFIRWLGPREMTMTIDKFDPQPGGSFRYIHHDPAGKEHAFHGVYHEVNAPERIIETFEYEGLPETGHVILETFRLEALPGDRTRLTIHDVFQSVNDRDGMLQSGMQTGMDESHARLDELLVRVY